MKLFKRPSDEDISKPRFLTGDLFQDTLVMFYWDQRQPVSVNTFDVSQ